MCKGEDKIDIGVLSQNINSGINFIKSQQWNMANYSLLMLGAIIAAFHLLWYSIDFICSLLWIMRIIFALLAIFAAIFTWIYSNKLYKIYETDLMKYQGIIDKLSNSDNDNYSYTIREKVFKKYPDIKDEFNRRDIGKRNTAFIIWLHRTVTLIGVIFSIFYFSFKLYICFILWMFVEMDINLTTGGIVFVAMIIFWLFKMMELSND